MSLTVSFTAIQDASNPLVVLFTDTSAGSDSAITSRRIYSKLHSGNFLVQKTTTTQYETWPINSSSWTLPILNKDYALEVTVQWLNGNAVVYTKTITFLYKAYAEQFRYNLTQYQSGNPKMLANPNFYSNKMKLKVLVDDATQAVEQYNDQISAQYALDAAKQLIDNPIYFN